MPRFKLTIEYDGRPYVGWQRQDNGPSVQQALEEATAGIEVGLAVLDVGVEREGPPSALKTR